MAFINHNHSHASHHDSNWPISNTVSAGLTSYDIGKALHDARCAGYDLDNIEAILMNRDDFRSLLKNLHEQSPGYSGPSKNFGEVIMYGVKFLESHHVSKGTIFKIFKDESKPWHKQTFASHTLDPVIPKNGKTTEDVPKDKPESDQYSEKRRIDL
jgi:hypothetical protein